MSETHIEELKPAQPTDQASETSEMSGATTSAQAGSPVVNSVPEDQYESEPTIVETGDQGDHKGDDEKATNADSINIEGAIDIDDKENNADVVKAETGTGQHNDEAEVKDYTHAAAEGTDQKISELDLLAGKDKAAGTAETGIASGGATEIQHAQDSAKITEAVLQDKDSELGKTMSAKEKNADEEKKQQQLSETCEVTSSTSATKTATGNQKAVGSGRNSEVSSSRRSSASSRRQSYNMSRGSINSGSFQNYGLTYLPYKSNFEPSEDARRRADEFFKTLKL